MWKVRLLRAFRSDPHHHMKHTFNNRIVISMASICYYTSFHKGHMLHLKLNVTTLAQCLIIHRTKTHHRAFEVHDVTVQTLHPKP